MSQQHQQSSRLRVILVFEYCLLEWLPQVSYRKLIESLLRTVNKAEPQMPELYRLHYAPDNASLIVRLVLLELDVPFESILVDRKEQQQKSSRYLKINPAGLIPALETEDGILFETGAILLWLSEKYGTMAPQPGSTERADFLKWMFYVSNTLHANLRMHFYPQQYIDTDQTALMAKCETNLTRSLQLLEAVAGEGHSWLNGDTPSVLDFYLAACLRWMHLYATKNGTWFSLANWPNLFALCAKLDHRQSVLAASPIEGFKEKPFTDPQPVTPQKGSAL